MSLIGKVAVSARSDKGLLVSCLIDDPRRRFAPGRPCRRGTWRSRLPRETWNGPRRGVSHEVPVTNSVEAPDWSTIPAPDDDGAARHLPGARVPSVPLASTDGTTVDLATLRGRVVVYAYPRTGRPGTANPDGWNLIPGARGCTPQACSFRDHFAELQALGVAHLFGLSTQDTAYQHEAAARLHLPFALLSDEDLSLARALRLPTFAAAGITLLKRLTLVIADGIVAHVFYPVFPPDRSASDVVAWLSARAQSQRPAS
jgi:peroxiredoxin